jgi:hypothetical protein
LYQAEPTFDDSDPFDHPRITVGFRSTVPSGSLPPMATDKRERQRANRAEKKAAEAKVQRRQNYFGLAKKYGGYALLIVIALVLITVLS